MRVGRSLQQVDLAHEASRPREACKREQEHRKQHAHHRLCPAKPRVVLDLQAFFGLMCHANHDREGADVHDCIDQQIEEQARRASFVRRGDRNEQVAGVCDARVCKHALYVRLNERHEVGGDHREGRQPPHDGVPGVIRSIETHDEDPQERYERGRLYRCGHERRHGCGCAFVNVRRPHVERHGRHLEAEPDGQERDPDRKQR